MVDAGRNHGGSDSVGLVRVAPRSKCWCLSIFRV